jgi:Ulp1 family protease
VIIYDTVYAEIDIKIRTVLANLFRSKHCVMVNIPKQDGNKDCGVFSIAIMTALLYGQNPAEVNFKQDML